MFGVCAYAMNDNQCKYAIRDETESKLFSIQHCRSIAVFD